MAEGKSPAEGKPSNRKAVSLRDLVLRPGGISDVFTTIGQFIEHVGRTRQGWQQEDSNFKLSDDRQLLNSSSLVGQVWFRGHRQCDLSLQPGLYRSETIEKLLKKDRPTTSHDEGFLFAELMDLEHEQRIDFISYGHLLNPANQAKTQIDWYFLMQHHGVPTRLLDWTTNALAALFFGLDSYGRKVCTCENSDDCIAVWMMDAYWLADRLSEDWYGPILPWSADALEYVPQLEQLLERPTYSKRIVPAEAMPIEPPAMHPRVAAQEGRFIIFGRERDLLNHEVELEKTDACEDEKARIVQVRFRVSDLNSLLEELTDLGVSSRTMFPDLGGLADFIRWKHFHKVGGYNLERGG